MKFVVVAFLFLPSVIACSSGVEDQGDSSSPLQAKTQSKPEERRQAQSPDSLEEMKACGAGNECVIVDGGCGSPLAINKKHLEAARPHLEAIYAAISCAPPPQQSVAATAVCQDNVCQVVR